MVEDRHLARHVFRETEDRPGTRFRGKGVKSKLSEPNTSADLERRGEPPKLSLFKSIYMASSKKEGIGYIV